MLKAGCKVLELLQYHKYRLFTGKTFKLILNEKF